MLSTLLSTVIPSAFEGPCASPGVQYPTRAVKRSYSHFLVSACSVNLLCCSSYADQNAQSLARSPEERVDADLVLCASGSPYATVAGIASSAGNAHSRAEIGDQRSNPVAETPPCPRRKRLLYSPRCDTDGNTIRLESDPDCDGANACFLGILRAKRGGKFRSRR
jgi:hypothetical protein